MTFDSDFVLCGDEYDISSSDFVDQWILSFADIDFINSKPAATRLSLAAQLRFFSARGFFAADGTLVPHDPAEYLAEQIASQLTNSPAMISVGALPIGVALRSCNILDIAA